MADPFLSQLGQGLGIGPVADGDAYAQAVGNGLFTPAGGPPMSQSPGAPPPAMSAAGLPAYDPATMGPIGGASVATGPAEALAPPPPPRVPYAPGHGPPPPSGPMFGPPSEPKPAPQPAPMAMMMMGGRTPAREVNVFGPTQWSALRNQNSADTQAAENIAQRTGDYAIGAEAQAYAQEREAQARQGAAEEAAQVHADELEKRHADFDATVKQLSAIESDRKKSTAEGNDASFFVNLFGGLVGLMGGPKASFAVAPILGAINKRIDQNVQSQELAYKAGVDNAKGKQSSFAMAMEKFHSQDAARAAVRGASLDTVAAQLQRLRAKETNIHAQNELDKALANIEAQKADQIMKGVRYVQPTAGGARYVVNVGGQPVVMDAKQYVEHVKSGGEMALKVMAQDVELSKAGAQHQGRFVRLPNGATIDAGDEGVAKELRTKVTAAEGVRSLVNQALALRQKTFTPGAVLSPMESSRNIARLKSIQSQLTVEAKNAAGLGALSGPDMNLVTEATGSLTSPFPGVDEQLRSFSAKSVQDVSRFTDTLPGAVGVQTGYASQMPGSFKPAGK